MVQPVVDSPVATAETDDERLLIAADYHAGLEVRLRTEGVELASAAGERRERLVRLVDRERPDRVVLLGDVGDAIGTPGDEERAELRALFDALTDRAPVVVAKGNHDGGLAAVADAYDAVTLSEGAGICVGDIGFAHGHTWPNPAVLSSETVCVAHEHPQVRLTDEVGGARTERVWLRGRLAPGPFREHNGMEPEADCVVFPAFNDRVGGTWVNEADDFLAPFLPEGLANGEAYLLDGTRLGAYERV
ncbi:metallophosphoesterase [Halosegnis sp.]|uniref:metallophosphoesterase n=1 Tax=Halosegnis sp. TaxID=2864959 RepID=UPI0035D48244